VTHQWNSEWAVSPTRLRIFIPDTGTHPELPSQEEPVSDLTASAPASGVSAHVCTDGVWPPLRPECGVEEQTVDHVFFQCPIHRRPHGLHGLTVLDDETIE